MKITDEERRSIERRRAREEVEREKELGLFFDIKERQKFVRDAYHAWVAGVPHPVGGDGPPPDPDAGDFNGRLPQNTTQARRRRRSSIVLMHHMSNMGPGPGPRGGLLYARGVNGVDGPGNGVGSMLDNTVSALPAYSPPAEKRDDGYSTVPMGSGGLITPRSMVVQRYGDPRGT